MEEALRERETILNKLLPNLFKTKYLPDEGLIRNIEIHKTLAKQPHKITSVKTIKIDVDAIFENYQPKLEIAQSVAASKCPLSQATIQIPWVGKCGHVFEEKCILAYINKGEHYCPIHGCDKYLEKK